MTKRKTLADNNRRSAFKIFRFACFYEERCLQLTPFPTQLSGAKFLAQRQHALLADEPRAGKTGTAIIAADYNLDDTILIVTTASGRPVWKRAIAQWSAFPRTVQVIARGGAVRASVVVVGWDQIADPQLRNALLERRWDRIILDEAHRASNFEAKRTQAAYGTMLDDILMHRGALAGAGNGVWCLTGTPFPHDLSNIYPMLRSLFPDRLAADPDKGWPNVTDFIDFRNRYCKWKMKKLPRGFRKIPVIFGGKNEAELRARMDGIWLLRTQEDVGIRPPSYDILPLVADDKTLRQAEGDLDRTTILQAARDGNTRDLDMHMGPLRRMTGEIKARLVVDAVKDEFDGGLDKIVLAYWHKDVGDILADGLADFGVLRIDGSTAPEARGPIEQEWLASTKKRVFLAQIEAAGEAIDLSSACVLWFAETTWSPRAMKQMSLRITNHTQTRNAFVRVCVLSGSIDEALQQILIRLWASIREVLK